MYTCTLCKNKLLKKCKSTKTRKSNNGKGLKNQAWLLTCKRIFNVDRLVAGRNIRKVTAAMSATLFSDCLGKESRRSHFRSFFGSSLCWWKHEIEVGEKTEGEGSTIICVVLSTLPICAPWRVCFWGFLFTSPFSPSQLHCCRLLLYLFWFIGNSKWMCVKQESTLPHEPHSLSFPLFSAICLLLGVPSKRVGALLLCCDWKSRHRISFLTFLFPPMMKIYILHRKTYKPYNHNHIKIRRVNMVFFAIPIQHLFTMFCLPIV